MVIHNNSKIIAFIAVVSLGFLAPGLINVSAADSDSAVLEAIVAPSVSITLSQEDISLSVNPVNKEFDSEDITASITTNNTDGYNLYLYSDNTSLVNQSHATKTLETLPTSATGYDEDSFLSDKWGYKIGDANYFGLVSGAIIGTSDGPVDEEETTLTFGAKVGYDTAAGNYNGSLVFRAVPIIST